MPEIATKRKLDKVLTKGMVTAAYFSTSGYVENKEWGTLLTEKNNEIIAKEDSGSFKKHRDENSDRTSMIVKEGVGLSTENSDENEDKTEKNQLPAIRHEPFVKQTSNGDPMTVLSTATLKQSQVKFGSETVLRQSEEKLSVISEKSFETDSYRTITSVQSTRTVFITELYQEQFMQTNSDKTVQTKTSKTPKRAKIDKTEPRKSAGKKKTRKKLNQHHQPDKNINFDVPIVYQRQNTAELLYAHDQPIPVARPSVNRKISNVRNKMYGNHLRESTKKLQNDLRQTMKKYSSEKSNLLKQLSSLRNEMGDLKLESSCSSTVSEMSSHRSSQSQSRYYMAPNLAAHKIGKKQKKTKTQETKITSTEENVRHTKDGILKLPSINAQTSTFKFYPKTPPKNIEWDSGRHNSGYNRSVKHLPSLDALPGLAAAQDLLNDSFKIPKVTDSTRNDIARLHTRGNKKKVHFAEKHSVNEFSGHRDFQQDFMTKKNSQFWGDTKSLPPISNKDDLSVDSIKAYSALPPIPWRNNDLDPEEIMKATQEYKSLYLKMKDPEQRMKTLAEILYSVRLRMIENEHTIKYGITPKHMKSANTLCDFLMNRNHYSSMSMNSVNSEMSNDIRGIPGIPNNTASRSGRKSSSLQLQNYLRKMSRSRRPSEEIRLSRMMGQQNALSEISEQPKTNPVTN